MPTYSRLYLRQTLGRDYLRDTRVGATTATGPALVDSAAADTSLGSQGNYERAWALHQGMELRVASFNSASGAFLSAQILGTLVASGGAYEVHEMVGPTEKNRALDAAIGHVRLRQEVAIPTVDGAYVYTLAGAGSPHYLERVVEVYRLADPTNSLNPQVDRLPTSLARVVATATGNVLRTDSPFPSGQMLVLDAILVPSLGALDTATVNLPDAAWVLYGAEAQCWELLLKRSPGTNAGTYRMNAQRAAAAFRAGARQFQPRPEMPLRFETSNF